MRDSVVFVLREHAILVRSGADKQLFEITLDFTSEGECKLVVNDQQRDFWQVRRMALDSKAKMTPDVMAKIDTIVGNKPKGPERFKR